MASRPLAMVLRAATVITVSCGAVPHTVATPAPIDASRHVELVPWSASREIGEPLAIRSCDDDKRCLDMLVVPAGRRLFSVAVSQDRRHAAAVVATDADRGLAELWMIDAAARTVTRSRDFGVADPTDGIARWAGARCFYGVYRPGDVHMSVFDPDGSKWLSAEGGNVWPRPDGLFMMTTPSPKAPGHPDIVLTDVERGRRTIVGPNLSGSLDLVTWEGTDAILWWRNGSSRHVPLPTTQACCSP